MPHFPHAYSNIVDQNHFFFHIKCCLIAERILLSMYFGTVQISGSALRLSKLDYPVPCIYLKMVVCVFHPSGLTLFTSSALLWRESTFLRLHPTRTFWGGLTFVYFLYWLNFHLPRTAILSLLLAGSHSLSVFCCRTHFSRYFNMCMNVFLLIICKCTNKYVIFQVFL